MIADLIAVLFLSRDIAHREHLSTTSFSQHMALGEFYPGVIDLADKLAEAYQGRHGLIGTIPLAENDFKSGGAVGILSQHLMWIENNRYKAAAKTDSTLQNIIDEVIALYLSTLYKLKHLK
jgi:hypothetical protein